MKVLRILLAELYRPDAHIVLNPQTQSAKLHSGDSVLSVASDDLTKLLEYGWIERYNSIDDEHRYRITETGKQTNLSDTQIP